MFSHKNMTKSEFHTTPLKINSFTRMKKKVYIVLLLLIPFVFQACLKDQADIFDESPAVRMEKVLTAYKELLASSNNGWLLEAYPERNQSYGGYSFILKFTSSSVDAFSELSDDIAESSGETLYVLNSDDGPVLSFDTYNSFLHFFATPSASLTDGYQGDLGYVLMGVSDDKNEIRLRGKKTGNDMMLRRMTVEPVTYLEKLQEIEEKIDAPAYMLEIAGKQVSINLSDRQFAYQYEGEEEAIEKGEIAYSVTDKGIRLYKPFELDDFAVGEFILEEDKFVSVDGKFTMKFVYPPVNEVFVNGGSDYLFYSNLTDPTILNVSSVVNNWFTAVYNLNMEEEGEDLARILFSTSSQSIEFASNFAAGRYYISNYGYTVAVVEGSDNKVKFDKKYTIKDGNADYYNYNFGKELIQYIMNEEVYILEPNALNPTSIKFISEKDPTIWFVLSK